MEEKTIYAITVKQPKSFGRWDTYTLVFTNRRTIIAQLTTKMANEAAAEANRQGKAEGKGFFERWGDQFKALYGYSKRYLDMDPEKILKENKGNFAIDNSEVKKIELGRIKKEVIQGIERVTGAEITIEAKKQKFSCEASDYAEKLQDSLSQIFGERVKIG